MNRADTTQVLELVAGYDCREITADLISEWHTAIGHLDRAVAEEAVHIHHKTTGFRITPEAVLDITQQIQTRTTTTPNRKRRARMGTYTITGAINDHCPDCGAQPGHTCTRHGHETAMPCISRLLGRPVGNRQQSAH
ncbi:hypothetical protein IU443_28425 [Nocardia farcinica]|uniref:Uncharacterized protein n=1 Tax=Nocardia farcinica TaxID=37329 RepID=A0A0H5P917_NOCFR|nr:hypothetical protein [Nocardia farcinica]AXK88538.1 hypothetical protein DXT66_25600 [Nocardia farcinica]MBF6393858.1 hypothetical protein [Nocardia farcinica]PFW98839.1 hypothetical protein CJ469_05800 [Nocardia farcinica]PFX04445.1 hypothetical protein CJ468_05421 [Nocardia farcinica]CRY84197.1 Uncharacterised protein [Nocardia farcinica]